jgi:outer membrane protein assembly complex protein YaeT
MPRRPFSSLVLAAPLALLLAACHQDGDIQVKNISFEGVKAVDAGQLKRILATQESAWLPWGRKRFFDRGQFDRDLERIRAFYADRGYPDARVSSFDVRLNEAHDAASISIVISEGEPVIVDAAEFVGFDPLTDDQLERLKENAAIRPGSPRDRQFVQVTREHAATVLKDHGYAYAQVQVAETGVADKRVRLTLTAEPGTIAYFGPIDVAGNVAVDDAVIRRQLTFRTGELYRVSDVQESQRKLYAIDLFEFVAIEPVDAAAERPEVRTRVTVTEGKHRRVNFSGGYGSEEKARVEGQWNHVNFLGGARTVGVHAKWSSLDRGVRLNYNEPYFFDSRISLGANVQTWYSNEPAYRLNTQGGRVVITRRHGRRDPVERSQVSTTLSLSLIHEYEDYSISNEALEDPTFRDDLIALGLDPRTGAGDGTLSALAFEFQRNTTANLLDARQGYVATVHVEQAGKLLPGDFNYYEVTAEGRHYWTIGGRAVLANRVHIASIDGTDPDDVPFFKRYFLGGSTSLRGWGRFEVGPLSGAGLPIGGLAMLELSSELRVPLWGKLGGVAFVDAGNVWPSAWDFFEGEGLRVSVGPGLRYQTPVGPVRVDVGYQLTPIDGLLVNGEPEPRNFRIHFSLGQAF